MLVGEPYAHLKAIKYKGFCILKKAHDLYKSCAFMLNSYLIQSHPSPREMYMLYTPWLPMENR